MKKKLHILIYRHLLIWICCISPVCLIGQTTEIHSPVPTIRTSPQAEAIKRYGEYQVNYSTGIPDISIPLYEINHMGYKIPISLKYSPQPLKPGYNYDVFGHGWGLSVNSCISRTIEGAPDEKTNFQLETNKLNNNYSIWGGKIMSINTAYDQFNATLPDGSSFDFTIQRDYSGILNYVISNNRSVKISYTLGGYDNPIQSFTVIDELGVKYTFSEGDLPQFESSSMSDYSYYYVSWLLTRIDLPNSTTPILFNYGLRIVGKNAWYPVFNEPCISISRNFDGTSDHVTASNSSEGQEFHYKMRFLSSISYGNSSVSLGYLYSDTDIKSNYVDSINIYNNGTNTRTIKLAKSFHNFTYTGNAGNNSIARLDKVLIYGTNKNAIPLTYKFNYTTNSYYFGGTDHWGYLNNSDISNKVANFNMYVSHNKSYYNLSSLMLPVTYLTKSKQDPCPFEKIKLLLARDSTINPRLPAGTGTQPILDRIVYPTGGYTDFFFENNSFLSSTDAYGNYIYDRKKRVSTTGGGFRIKSITNYTATGVKANHQEFAYGKTLAEANGWAGVYYENAHTGVGEAVVDPNILTYTSCNSYTESQTLDSYYPIRYMAIGLSLYGVGNSFSDPMNTLIWNGKAFGWSCKISANNFRKILNGRPPVVYPEVTVYYTENTGLNPEAGIGKTVYKYNINTIQYGAYDSHESQLDTVFFEYPKYYGNVLSYEPRGYLYNQLSERTDYTYVDNAYKIVKKEINTWNTNYLTIAEYQYTDPLMQGHVFSSATLSNFFTSKFRYCGGSQLRTKETIIYNSKSAPPIQQVESYSYNDRYQLYSKTLNDKYTPITTYYKYPMVYSGKTTPEVIQKMVDRNIISPVIESKVFRPLSSKYIAGDSIEYKEFVVGNSSLLLPYKTYKLNTLTSNYELENEVPYYSGQSNPLEIISRDNVHTAYLWGYGNRYLIAEFKSATSSQVEAAVSDIFGTTMQNFSDMSYYDSDKLRSLCSNSNLSGAFVTTFIYNSSGNVVSTTASNNITTYYEYDAFNRLKRTYIKENNVEKTVQSYDYHYQQ